MHTELQKGKEPNAAKQGNKSFFLSPCARNQSCLHLFATESFQNSLEIIGDSVRQTES